MDSLLEFTKEANAQVLIAKIYLKAQHVLCKIFLENCMVPI